MVCWEPWESVSMADIDGRPYSGGLPRKVPTGCQDHVCRIDGLPQIRWAASCRVQSHRIQKSLCGSLIHWRKRPELSELISSHVNPSSDDSLLPSEVEGRTGYRVFSRVNAGRASRKKHNSIVFRDEKRVVGDVALSRKPFFDVRIGYDGGRFAPVIRPQIEAVSPGNAIGHLRGTGVETEPIPCVSVGSAIGDVRVAPRTEFEAVSEVEAGEAVLDNGERVVIAENRLKSRTGDGTPPYHGSTASAANAALSSFHRDTLDSSFLWGLDSSIGLSRWRNQNSLARSVAQPFPLTRRKATGYIFRPRSLS